MSIGTDSGGTDYDVVSIPVNAVEVFDGGFNVGGYRVETVGFQTYPSRVEARTRHGRSSARTLGQVSVELATNADVFPSDRTAGDEAESLLAMRSDLGYIGHDSEGGTDRSTRLTNTSLSENWIVG
ncbi:hypothetical protein [Halorussus caseinilyticus]|uniref:Uncharacterized protein n=1 Tax=Halorussus caseinilyticus TaxID=3034025 RepID=A0ABD5WI27_9EURY|nr:hypothetical protein [Halorussus sp. DT72]